MSSCFEIEAIPEGQQVLADENEQAENLNATMSQAVNGASESQNTPTKQFSANATGMADEMQSQFMQIAAPALSHCINQAAYAR